MAGKRTKAAPTDDELGNLFEGIGDDTAIKKSTKAKPTTAKAKAEAAERDILAELENQLGEKAPERPHTPRIREVKRTSTNTPPPPAVDTARKSAESTASHHAAQTPSATSSDPRESEKKAPVQQTQAAGGGGWWGGLLSTATAAMKQAEAAVSQIQQNEEAKKWADQVRGNVGALRGFGSCLSVLPPHCSWPNTNMTLRPQATNSDTAPSPLSPTSCTPSPRPSRRTSAS